MQIWIVLTRHGPSWPRPLLRAHALRNLALLAAVLDLPVLADARPISLSVMLAYSQVPAQPQSLQIGSICCALRVAA